MKLLAIETASEACSVALWLDGVVHERHVVEPRRHAALVLGMVDELLSDGQQLLLGHDGVGGWVLVMFRVLASTIRHRSST